jgi:hypothetical protein
MKPPRNPPAVLRLKKKRAFMTAEALAAAIAETYRKKDSETGSGPPAEKAPVEAENPVLAAERHFGTRLVYRPTGERLLDGSHCDLDRLMKAWNRERRLHGLPPRGNKREWLA